MKTTLKRTLIIIALSIVIIACNNRKGDNVGYEIALSLTGFKDSTKFKLFNSEKGDLIDSTYIINGKLVFKGKVEEPSSAKIKAMDKDLFLWLENKEISIHGNLINFTYSEINGSAINEIMVKYRDKQKDLQIKRDSLTREAIKLMSSEGKEQEEKKIWQRIRKIDKKMINIRKQSIELEEPSLYTLKELYFLRKAIAKDSLKRFFNKFPETLQKTKYGDVINIYIENKALIVGDRFIDIQGINEDGLTVPLSSLKGKYILLDFWASSCRACRQENPNLVKAYDKFNKQGFEIYSFSTDNNISSWKRAIRKDSLTWTNVIDTKGSYSKMSALYGVQSIPSSFLINPQGVIIAKNLRGNKLEETLEKELNEM